MGKGEFGKPTAMMGSTSNKKRGLKPVTAGMRERESEERKDALRNRIELKRLQSLVDRLRLDLQGLGEGSKKKERVIDPQYRLKGAARAALEHYLPPEPEFIGPPNLLIQQKGKLWNILPKGREFLQALYDLAQLLHNTFKKSRDAIDYFKEILEYDEEDHLQARIRVFQCYLDKGDTKSAQEWSQQHSQSLASAPASSTNNDYLSMIELYNMVLVTITEEERAYLKRQQQQAAQEPVAPALSKKQQKKLMQQQKQQQLNGEDNGVDEDDDEMDIDQLLTPRVITVIDQAAIGNEYLVWMLAYAKSFTAVWALTQEEIDSIVAELPVLINTQDKETLQQVIRAWTYHKDGGYLWEGTMTTPIVVPKTKVEKLSNRANGITTSAEDANNQPEYEPSMFELVLQEYIVDKVLSPPAIVGISSNYATNKLVLAYDSSMRELEKILLQE